MMKKKMTGNQQGRNSVVHPNADDINQIRIGLLESPKEGDRSGDPQPSHRVRFPNKIENKEAKLIFERKHDSITSLSQQRKQYRKNSNHEAKIASV